MCSHHHAAATGMFLALGYEACHPSDRDRAAGQNEREFFTDVLVPAALMLEDIRSAYFEHSDRPTPDDWDLSIAFDLGRRLTLKTWNIARPIDEQIRDVIMQLVEERTGAPA